MPGHRGGKPRPCEGPALAFLLPCLALALVSVTLVPAAAAQNEFVPTVSPLDPSPAFCWIDLGRTGTFTDDGFYLHTRDTNGDGDPVGDARIASTAIRLIQILEQPPGSLVEDGDVAERSADATCREVELDWIDRDDDGTFTNEDWLFIGTDPADDKVGPSGGEAGQPVRWIRVTRTPSGAPGTLVRTGDTDMVGFTGEGTFTGVVALFDADNSGELTPADTVVITSRAIGSNAVIPVFSLILYTPPPALDPGTPPDEDLPPAIDPTPEPPPDTDPEPAPDAPVGDTEPDDGSVVAEVNVSNPPGSSLPGAPTEPGGAPAMAVDDGTGEPTDRPDNTSGSAPPSSTPPPGSWILILLTALGAIASARRRRR